MSKIEDLTGRVYGSLTVICQDLDCSRVAWICDCKCGGFRSKVRSLELKNGEVKECSGCVREKVLLNLIEKSSTRVNHYFCVTEDFRPHKKVEVMCHAHGMYTQKPYDMLKGKVGCKACQKQIIKDTGLALFHDRVSSLYAGKYTYPYIEHEYKSSTSTISVLCKDHGLFRTVAAQHSKGHSCFKCYWSMSNSEFTSKAALTHGDTYDYSLVKYEGSHKKVDILCKRHGCFSQSPNSHFCGSGCPTCAFEGRSYDFLFKYQSCKELGESEGCIYVIKGTNETEEFVKVGISRNFKNRLSALNKSDYTFSVVEIFTCNNLTSATVEGSMLEWKKAHRAHYWPRKPFDGRGECFTMESLPEILTKIGEELMKYTHNSESLSE